MSVDSWAGFLLDTGLGKVSLESNHQSWTEAELEKAKQSAIAYLGDR